MSLTRRSFVVGLLTAPVVLRLAPKLPLPRIDYGVGAHVGAAIGAAVGAAVVQAYVDVGAIDGIISQPAMERRAIAAKRSWHMSEGRKQPRPAPAGIRKPPPPPAPPPRRRWA